MDLQCTGLDIACDLVVFDSNLQFIEVDVDFQSERQSRSPLRPDPVTLFPGSSGIDQNSNRDGAAMSHASRLSNCLMSNQWALISKILTPPRSRHPKFER